MAKSSIASAKTKYTAVQTNAAESAYKSSDPKGIVEGYAVAKQRIERFIGLEVEQLQRAIDSEEYDASSVATMSTAITALNAISIPNL